MKSVFDLTEIKRTKFISDVAVSYVTSGTSGKFTIESKNSTIIVDLFNQYKPQLIKVSDNLLEMQVEDINYIDSPNYYVSQKIEDMFLSICENVETYLNKKKEEENGEEKS